MASKVLVTTAIEETWPLNKDSVIFLGEWCLRYDRREIWKAMDFKVATYHWDDREKLHADYQYLNELHESLLCDLQKYLNTHHQTDHSVRYWRIQLGPWMGFIIPILFDRWTMLNNVATEYDISGMYSVPYKLEDVIAQDTKQFVELSLLDSWNQIIFSELATHIGVNVQEVVDLSGEALEIPKKNQPETKHTLKARLKRLLQYLSAKLSTDSDVFFITPYLSKFESFRLQLKLRQFPSIWESPELFIHEKPDSSIRRGLVKQDDDFRKIALVMLKRHMPIVFLEGYKSSLNVVQNMPWPKTPQSIVTAVSWNVDDLFKLYAGENIENGVALITIQHGGNFGIAKWNFFEEHQVKISDEHLTWGWDDDSSKKVVPFCNVKNLEGNIQSSKTGGVLLVGLTLPSFSYLMFSGTVAAGQLNQHFNDQVSFLAHLPEHIVSQTTLRIESGFGSCQMEQWKDQLDQHPILLEDVNDCSMDESLRRSRLCVSTYNATVFLETMSLGLPTLIFWNPRHWELREAAVPYFELLQSVGIFHTTPESAAQQLTKIWDDVDGWWSSEAVISARNRFCHKYARKIDDPIEFLVSRASMDYASV